MTHETNVQLQAQLDEWKKHGEKGQIIQKGARLLEFVHWTTSEIQAKKQQITQLELSYLDQRKRLEGEIAGLESNQAQRKAHYDLCMDALGQVRKFAPPKEGPKPVEVVVPKKTTAKKKKIIQVEVEEEEPNGELHDSGKGSPPIG